MKVTHDKQVRTEPVSETKKSHGVFELWKHIGATRARKVGVKGLAATDSMLAVSKDCLTYTFILDREVASIHFDRIRGEIFFKGHNLKNMDLTPSQMEALKGLKVVLAQDERARPFLSDYGATLDRRLADKR
jgi:hypothetical protein